MSVWRPQSVKAEPVTDLHEWSAYRVEFQHGKPSRHFVGTAWDGGRVCSPLVAYDPKSRVGITRSGRHYRLVGPNGKGYTSIDAAYVFSIWKKNNKVKSAHPLRRLTRLS